MENIFISSINVKKIRNIENLQIKVSDTEKKHLILTGKNGTGKTTLLENIKKYLSSLDSDRYFRLLNVDKNIQHYRNILDSSRENDNFQIQKEAEDNIKYYENEKIKYGNGIKLNIKNDERLQKIYNEGEFVISYFEAKRNVNVQIPNGVEKIVLNDRYTLEQNPASIFLKYLVDLKTQQSFAKNENDNEEVLKIERWFNNFENALKELLDDKDLRLVFDYRNYNFTIKESKKEPYRFNELSDGYSSVLDIVIDLMMRMEKKSSLLYDLSGIVMIDEIETHLHIELQKRIMGFLIKLFPNIQFIVTTHSPFILNSTPNAVIYDLENKIKVESLTAYSYEGIVEEYFNVNQYSQEIIEKVQRYEILINKKEKTDYEIDEMYEIERLLDQIPIHSQELEFKVNQLKIKRRAIKID